MSVDIKKLPVTELVNDLTETLADIALCRKALLVGVEDYSGGSVRDRLEANKQIFHKISAELRRRHVSEDALPSLEDTDASSVG